jgi:hypothetical protein
MGGMDAAALGPLGGSRMKSDIPEPRRQATEDREGKDKSGGRNAGVLAAT